MDPDYTQPVRLDPVCIPKPWGQEIWYTGMEVRGESGALLPDGSRVPLSRYLSQDPVAACANEPVLLLKILDPRPEPVLGDLYFEVHTQKREVYVVTHVSKDAWPDGTGAIRFGMCQEQRRQLGDDGLRAKFLQAVSSYEKVRRALDAGTRSPFLVMQEMALRDHMDSYTHLRPLRVGDIVHVPTGFPHALQHGVRVVEFQTATYERLIVSFAQKVVTQDHWDTATAVDLMSLDPGLIQAPESVTAGVERIARFDHFNVWRMDAAAGPVTLPRHIPYAVLMAVGGVARVGPLVLEPETAAFIPRAALSTASLAVTERDASLLVSAPGL